MRATDADRDSTTAIVAAAAADRRPTIDEMHEPLEPAFAARTHGELAELTRDLVPTAAVRGVAGASATAAPAAGAPYQQFVGISGRTTAVAVFGGVERKGNWTVPGHLQVVAVMGGADIDLTDAVFEQPHTAINVVAIMGGVQITAPPHVRVESHVSAIFGGCSNAADDGEGQFVVHVTGTAIFGGVDVKRPGRGRHPGSRGGRLGPPAPPPALPR